MLLIDPGEWGSRVSHVNKITIIKNLAGSSKIARGDTVATLFILFEPETVSISHIDERIQMFLILEMIIS